MLKILVCVKQVPDVDLVKMDPETGNLIRTGVPTLTNPLDLNALEAAVQVKERYGGVVTLITMGPPMADIRPTMTMNTPRAGPMAVTRPIRKAFLGISGSMRHSLVALLAARMNSTACTAAMMTVKLQRNHMIGRLEICK